VERFFEMASSSIKLSAQGAMDVIQLKDSKSAKIAPFSTEADLVAAFLTNLGFVRSKQKKLAIREFDCANGIADLVVAELATLNARSIRLGEITPRWLNALKSLPYRRIFLFDDFVRLTGVSKQRAAAALAEFETGRFCVRGGQENTWQKIWQPRPVATKIFAFEAKLKDWKKAMHQAERHKDFAHASCVVIDAAYIQPAIRNLREFQERNIGVIAYGQDDSFTVINAPVILEPRSMEKFWIANCLIAREIAGTNLRLK
jgi:hypothetical protein